MPLNPGVADLLTTPAAPTVVQNATGAGAAISYSIVAVNESGQDGIPSPATSTAANNAATPNNTISWVAVPAAAQYRILKNGALLATVAAGVTSFSDNAGAATSAYTATTSNPPANIPASSSPVDGQKSTYSFAILGLVPAALPTDVFNITGSASKAVRLLRLIVSGLQTTAGNIDVQVLKRSGGTQSAGTSQAANIVAHDPNNPAASALVQTYTANPASLGTLVGVIDAEKLFVPAAASVASPDKLILDFGNRPGQAHVLRAATQSISINLNGVTLTGGSLDIKCEWSEE